MSERRLLPLRAAAKALEMSETLLRDHVRDGNIRYVNTGRGAKRKRIAFAPEDLDAFIAARRTVESQPCQSTSRKGRVSTSSTSNSGVVAFSALRERRNAGRQKP